MSHAEVCLYAGKVLATKREAEIRLERQEGNGDERKETWKRKELALAGMGPAQIERAIEGWRNRRQQQKGGGGGTEGHRKGKKGIKRKRRNMPRKR